MRELKDIDSVEELKIIIRSLSLMEIEGDLDIKFNTPSFINFFHLWKFRKRKRLIHRICELGGVITGSRVLTNSYINDVRILNRNTDNSDWDILITEENLYKITSEIKFTESGEIGVHGERIFKLTYRVIDSDSYGHGACDIDLIVVKKLPKFYKKGELLLADPIYVIEEKMKSVDSKNNGDLKEIFWKFRELSNKY